MDTVADINRKIERAKRELEHMIDLNPSVMLLADNTGTIIRANKALLNMLGSPDYSTVLGRRMQDVFPCKDKTFFDKLIKNKSGYYSCQTNTELSGGASLLKFTIVGSGKQTELTAVIVNDITTENQNAAVMAKKYKKEAVIELTGALLHKINQPLTVIMMRAQLMQLEIEKGSVRADEMTGSLNDIMQLTLDIAATLEQLERPQDYFTEAYNESIQITDIKRSAGQINLSDAGVSTALIVALEVHDPGATEHALASSRAAMILARQMNMDELTCETIRRCAFLHDVGKLVVPTEILRKPGPLTPEEIVVMRKHPEAGYNILQKFPFLKDEAETAYSHAEWFNGAGYPRGLSGTGIPMTSRISAVADAYNALRQCRPYQAEIPAPDALRAIEKMSGTQFDPAVVEALKACYKTIESTVRPV